MFKRLFACLMVCAIANASVPADAALVELTGSSNNFGFDLFRQVSKDSKDANLLISPFSLSMALQMTYNGAAGTTRDAMAKVLRINNADINALNQQNKDLLAAMKKVQGKTKLEIANALFARNDIKFKKDFLAKNAQFFGAEVSTLDFKSPQALPTINGWVNKQTHGKIDKIIEEIDPLAILFLINAVYFKGLWKTPFDPKQTNNCPFHLSSGGTKQVKMMYRSGEMPYAQTPDFQAVRLPYGDGRLGMYLFLPSKKSSVSAFEASLSTENWKKWMSMFRDREGTIGLPRFKIEYKTKLKETLKAMGMAIAFNAATADFFPMADVRDRIYIGQVYHKTYMDVNEEGTEAAAVTAVEMRMESARMPSDPPFNMVLDRPFFLAIHDAETGSILFLGKVMNPS